MSTARLGPGDFDLRDETGKPRPLLSSDRLAPDVLAQLEAEAEAELKAAQAEANAAARRAS
jgi:hypothetical protein